MTYRTAGVRRAARRTIAAACAILIAGCAYALFKGKTINQDKVEEIRTGIQKTRQLDFEKPVPLVVKDRDEAEHQMEAELMHDYTDNQLWADGIAGAMVGLYPKGTDIKAESLKLLRNQVAGFYDPRTKEMVLVSGSLNTGFLTSSAEVLTQRDILGEMVLAHEFTHALQDQHFDLDRKLDVVKNNDDKGLGLKSVAEGDATIAGYGYVSKRMDEATLDTLLSHVNDIASAFASQAAETPEGIAEPLIFQYSDGVKFVGEAYRRGGWKAVDDLYAHPPQSAHQIIHPADYFEHPTPPVDVAVHGYETAMSSWTKADEDTYGELLLRIILKLNLDKGSPDVALAERWAGDDMVILQSERQISVIWLIAFTDAGSADKFAGLYWKILDKVSDATPRKIEQRDRAVLVLTGAAAQLNDKETAGIWSASKIETTTPQK